MRMYIMLAMISILVHPVVAMDNQSDQNNTTYRTLVSQHDGFYAVYQVYDMTLIKIANYQNNTLNISRGNTIVWISDTLLDERLTITSKENLWDWHNGTLAWSGKEFTYTFNTSGIYEVYIKEYPNYQQKIIVGSIESNSTSENITNVSNTEPNLTSENITNINNTKLNSTNTTNVSNIEPNSTSENITNVNNTEPNSTSENITNISNIEPNSTSENITNVNNTEPNSTSGNITNINNTKLNSTNVTNINNTKLNSTNVTNVVPISISLSDNRLDTIVLTLVLLSIFVLSGRVKDD